MKIYISRILKAVGLTKVYKDTVPLNDSNFIKNVCKFVVNECVVGDYYEFGVFKGQTLVAFYVRLMDVVKKRIANTGINDREGIALGLRKKIRSETIFHAFDSFEGLPPLTPDDEKSSDFAVGQYSSGIEIVRRLAERHGMPASRLRCHEGWFSETCTSEYLRASSLKPAAIIWLDCDLYSSARDALKLVGMLIQDGTMIIIDDWYCFKGHPERGVQKAWSEFINSDEIAQKFKFSDYQNDGWARKSFIVNQIET